MSGRLPFDAETPVSILLKHLNEIPPPLPPEIPAELRSFIGGLLAKDPNRRPSTASEVRAAISALETGSFPAPVVSTAPALSTAPVLQKPRRFPRALLAILGLFAFTKVCSWISDIEDKVEEGFKFEADLDDGKVKTRSHRKKRKHDHQKAASSNAEAVTLFEEGLAEVRGGVSSGCEKIRRAASLDPSFAAAQLRAATCWLPRADKGREAFRRALAGKESLGERDRALLDGMEPIFQRQPFDYKEAVRRLKKAKEEFSDDAELAFFVVLHDADSYGRPEMVDAIDEVLELDPNYGYAWGIRGQVLAYAGKFEEAFRSFDRCLEVSPRGSKCIETKINVLDEQGECARLETEARRLLATDPDLWGSYLSFANSLLAQGRPLASAREAARQAVGKAPETFRPDVEAEVELGLAAIEGRFTDALAIAESWAKRKSESIAEPDHAVPALATVRILQEIGEVRRAGAIAADFMARRDAWQPDPRTEDWAMAADPTAPMVAAQHRAGLLTDQAAAAELARRLAWWRERAAPMAKPFLWIHQFATGVETEDEARLALSAKGEFEPLPAHKPKVPADFHIGRTFYLGRHPDALPTLQRAAQACHPLRFPIENTRAHAFLARALEDKGDTAGACAAYAVVLQRWGKSKPPSITAQHARDRTKALSCGK